MEGKLRLQQKHGKARVRVARVWRQPGNTIIVEWNVSIMLYSDCIPAYTDGDNSDIVATDSMKNTVYAKAKECEKYVSVEDFGILLGKHFTSTYSQGHWVDENIDPNRTQVFFRGYSASHFSGGQWNSGGQCHTETQPIFNESYLIKYPPKMEVLESVIKEIKTPIIYLNITRITDYRKDGHPSVYRKQYLSQVERMAPEKYQDCSHWCLPGIPDTWNELLFAQLVSPQHKNGSALAGFNLGTGKHVVEINVSKDGTVEVASGVEGLTLLKTTQSGFVGFIRDKYTLLPETTERMLATEVCAVWRYSGKPSCYIKAYNAVKKTLVDVFFGPPHEGVYSPSVQNTLYCMAQAVLHRFPEIESIHLSMPNIHFLPANLPNIVKFDHDVYVPTDEPHGTIEASLSRKTFKTFSKL